MAKTILITGAGSGFGEAAAIGMAADGHHIIATVSLSAEVAPLREKARAFGLDNLCVEKLDLLDPDDITRAHTFDIDVLWNNAAFGESGPMVDIPFERVRRNYELNLFKPLELTMGFIKKWVEAKKKAKIVFTSWMGGLFTPAYWGVHVSTKHALESVAEAMQQELAPFGIKVQTISPGAFYTSYNQPMAELVSRWMHEARNFTKPHLGKTFDNFLNAPDGRLHAQEMINRTIEIIPSDTGKFRNVVPRATEEMLKAHEVAAWNNSI